MKVGRGRTFAIELDEDGCPQITKETADSDRSAWKNYTKKFRGLIDGVANEFASCNFVIVIESPLSPAIAVSAVRHTTNDKAWQDDMLMAVVTAMKRKTRDEAEPLSAFNYAPPPRAGLEDTLAEAVRQGILGEVVRKMLLDLAKKIEKKEEQNTRKREFLLPSARRRSPRLPSPLFTPRL